MKLRIERSSFNKLYRLVKGDGQPVSRDNWTSLGLGYKALETIAPSVRVEKDVGTLWFNEQHDAQAAKDRYEFESD